jgi:CheY-like chemotaxis protein
MIRRVAEASIRLEVRTCAEVGEIVADRHQIEQVLLNLAINACDAMGNRGTLAIAADMVELASGEAMCHRMLPGLYVRIAVSDTGTGMDEATRRSVFEPFFTTKEVGRGTGLGLAVAHGIVTQHGGQIDVESELGKGSTFTVYLPHARNTSQRHRVPIAQPVAAPAHQTVLVVEDEPAVLELAARVLCSRGYHVLRARTGSEALDLSAHFAGRVDLLLTDLIMPQMGGEALAARFLQTRPDARVLYMTGYSPQLVENPSDPVWLQKPLRASELLIAVRGVLDADTES